MSGLKDKIHSIKKILNNIGSTFFSIIFVLCGVVLIIGSTGLLGIFPVLIFSAILGIGFLYTAYKE